MFQSRSFHFILFIPVSARTWGKTASGEYGSPSSMSCRWPREAIYGTEGPKIQQFATETSYSNCWPRKVLLFKVFCFGKNKLFVFSPRAFVNDLAFPFGRGQTWQSTWVRPSQRKVNPRAHTINVLTYKSQLMSHLVTLGEEKCRVLWSQRIPSQAKFTSELGGLFGAWLTDPVFSVRCGPPQLQGTNCGR